MKKNVKKRRKRTEGRSKCILAKSIYEETDISKLTPRQQILHQKYQEQRDTVTSFFLTSNNISVGASAKDGDRPRRLSVRKKSETEAKNKKCNTEDSHEDVKDSNSENPEKKDVETGSSTSISEPCEADARFPPGTNICSDCFDDAVMTYDYLEEMSEIHTCKYNKMILVHKAMIRQNFKRRLCFSKIKTEAFRFMDVLDEVGCCAGSSN